MPLSRRSTRFQTGLHQALRITGLLFALTATGMLGFRVVSPDSSWLDCFYMTVITLSTVGFEHVVPATPAVKIFISGYLLIGLGVFTFSAFTLGQFLASDELRHMLEQRRMEQQMNRLSGHHIICGIGRMGRLICEELAAQQMQFVVVDTSSDALAVCRERGWLYLEGDATDDDVLRDAGIDRAASVAAALPADGDNVYVALSARMLSEQVQIVARATEEKAVEKLRRAGADKVVSPLASGATKVARFLISPGVEEFLDVASGHGDELSLADVRVPSECPLLGKRLNETDFRRRGLIVLCIRRDEGEQLVPPPPDADIRANDLLFLFGTAAAVRAAVMEILPTGRIARR